MFAPSAPAPSPSPGTGWSHTISSLDLKAPYYRALFANIWAVQKKGQSHITARFGASVAAGDMDGDGYDDLAVGAPGASHYIPLNTTQMPTPRLSGAVYLYFGGKRGIQIAADLSFRRDETTNYSTACSGAAQNTVCSPLLGKDKNGDADVTDAGEQFASPIKIIPAPDVMMSSDASNFGVSVAIGRMRDSSHTLHGSITNALDKGTLFIGAPNLSTTGRSAKGGVAMVDFNRHISWDNTSSPLAHGIPVVMVSSIRTYNDFALLRSVTPSNLLSSNMARFLYNPAGTGDHQFGQSVTVGAFRNPVVDSTNYPLANSLRTSKTINEVLAVGAPNADSGRGYVYLFTREALALLPADIEDTASSHHFGYKFNLLNYNYVTNNKVNDNLCVEASPTTCKDTMLLTNQVPAALGFGSTLATPRRPPEVKTCDTMPSNYCASQANGSIRAWASPVTYRDFLLAGALGGSNADLEGQRAYVYTAGQNSGLSGSPTILAGAQFQTGARFGASIAGGVFDKISTSFQSRVSYLVGAPEHDLPAPTTGNLYYYKAGDLGLATTPVAFASTVPRPNESLDFNMSEIQESATAFAKPVGDLNCDGYSDLALPVLYTGIGGQSAAYLLLLYGSRSGLVTSPVPANPKTQKRTGTDATSPQWLNLAFLGGSNFDPNGGLSFAGVGNVNGDRNGGLECDDLVVGLNKHFIFYGSSSGLVLDTPDRISGSPANAPQAIEMSFVARSFPTYNFCTVADATSGTFGTDEDNPRCNFLESDKVFEKLEGTHHDVAHAKHFFYNASGKYASFRVPDNPPICHGDFNGDGYNDVVIGTNIHSQYAHRTPVSETTYKTEGAASQFMWGPGYFNVFYGSTTGLQLYERATQGQSVDMAANCNGGQCPAHRLFHPGMFWRSGDDNDLADGANKTNFYPYNPWREFMMRKSMVSGDLKGYHTTLAGLLHERYGMLCASPGDLDGDGYSDLIVPNDSFVSRVRPSPCLSLCLSRGPGGCRYGFCAF